jgi:ArsR family transcriptional regulator
LVSKGLRVDPMVASLKAAGEATRLRILALLGQAELSVKDLTAILGQSQPRISRHLKLLAEAGLIDRYPEGAWVFYRLAEDGAGARMIRDLLAVVVDTQACPRSRALAESSAITPSGAPLLAANAGNGTDPRLHVAEDRVEPRS